MTGIGRDRKAARYKFVKSRNQRGGFVDRFIISIYWAIAVDTFLYGRINLESFMRVLKDKTISKFAIGKM